MTHFKPQPQSLQNKYQLNPTFYRTLLSDIFIRAINLKIIQNLRPMVAFKDRLRARVAFRDKLSLGLRLEIGLGLGLRLKIGLELGLHLEINLALGCV